MKYLILTSFLSFMPALLPSQPAIQWQKTYGGNSYDQAYSIQQTYDGGYIVTGSTASNSGDVFGNHGGNDFWVLKLDVLGSIQWKKTLGGSNNDWANSIQQTADGGYIVVGNTMSEDGDVTGSHGGIDGWIIKLDFAGNIDWQRALGGSGWEELWSVKQTTDGGFIVAGRSSEVSGDVTINHGALDVWVVKLNEIGGLEWEKSFGGSKDDNAHSIKETSDGGFIVVGETASNDGDVSGNKGNSDFWVIKLSKVGLLEWQKTFGGTGGDIANDVQQINDGGYIIIGYSGSNNSGDVSSHHGLFDYWIVRLNPEGELLWQKSLGGSNKDWGRSIISAKGGGFLIIGTTTSTDGDIVGNTGGAQFWALKLSVVGEIVWQKTLGGSQAEEGYSIEQTTDNGFILAGYTWSTNGDLAGATIQGYNDFWIVKLSPEMVSTNSPNNLYTLDLYPNPTRQSLTLQTPSEESNLDVNIVDLLGQTLQRQSISNGGQIDVSLLSQGMYLVVATSPTGKVYAGKVRKD